MFISQMNSYIGLIASLGYLPMLQANFLPTEGCFYSACLFSTILFLRLFNCPQSCSNIISTSVSMLFQRYSSNVCHINFQRLTLQGILLSWVKHPLGWELQISFCDTIICSLQDPRSSDLKRMGYGLVASSVEEMVASFVDELLEKSADVVE